MFILIDDKNLKIGENFSHETCLLILFKWSALHQIIFQKSLANNISIFSVYIWCHKNAHRSQEFNEKKKMKKDTYSYFMCLLSVIKMYYTTFVFPFFAAAEYRHLNSVSYIIISCIYGSNASNQKCRWLTLVFV